MTLTPSACLKRAEDRPRNTTMKSASLDSPVWVLISLESAIPTPQKDDTVAVRVIHHKANRRRA